MDVNIRKRLIAGGSYVAIAKAISFFCGIGILSILTRGLSPEELGTYFLGFSLVNFFAIFSLLGLEKGVVKFVSGSMAQKDSGSAWLAVKRVLFLGSAFAVLVGCLFAFGGGQFVSLRLLHSPLLFELAGLTGVWAVLFSIQRLLAESFRGYHDLKKASIFNGTLVNLLVLSSILGLFLSDAQFGLRRIFEIIVVSFIINNLVGLFYLRKKRHLSKVKKTSIADYRILLLASLPFCFSTLFLSGIQYVHIWLLAFFCNQDDVAIYGSVARLMVVMSSLLEMVRQVIPSFVGHLYATKEFGEVENLLRKSATLAAIPFVFIFFVVVVLGREALLLIYGSHYVSGYSVLLILSAGQLVNVFTGTPGVLLVMASKGKFLFLSAIVSGTVGILTSVFLVGDMGYDGVAIGASLGIVLQNVTMAYYCYRKLNIATHVNPNQILVMTRKLRGLM